ncbi:CHAD domain-containing protein [Alienimonas californiensis]|uniref:CHAD domain protein n=1 Tax=Alienimonas californiensis TaxID=2527989 RepID=A0A517PEY8_9PLAN|nr:CHAD domain-containing protein [Alienimonas californiensis]QDT17940.1 CHAD domain protein [Alienimonas californiensis]
MSFQFEPNEPVADGLRRIAREQLDKALAEVDGAAGGPADADLAEAVHEVRKRGKKLRALLRLVRPAFGGYAEENAAVRDATRRLSALRDATAVIETHDRLMDRYEDFVQRRAFGPVRAALTRHRKELEAIEPDGLDAGPPVSERLAAAGADLRTVRDRVDSWTLKEEGFDALAGGFAKTYKRARRSMAAAVDRPTPQQFHQWRKRAKYHRYHLRLLRDVWPEALGPRRDEAVRLSDLLGHEHDLTVYAATVLDAPDPPAHDPRQREVLHGLLHGSQEALRAESLTLGETLLAEKPKAFTGRLEAAWEAWRE